MYKLRDYQQKSHDATMEYLKQKKPKPGIVVAPTGSGKSILIAKLAQDYNEKVLVLCPSQEILSQNYEKFISIGGEASIYSASLNSKEIGHVTFASIGSVKNLGAKFKSLGVNLLATDEAHLGTDSSGGMFKTFLNTLKPEFNLGFTATPFRLKQYNDVTGMKFSQLNMLTRTRPKLYSNFIHVTQIQELTSNGFWASIEIENHNLDTSKLFLNSTGAEYNQESIERVNKAENTNNKIYKRTKELMLEKNSILIFMDNVENCYIMKKALGNLCEVISGETDKKERNRILTAFKEGKIKVVCCFMTLVVGFDFPALDCVIMGRPTNSLAVFYQVYGRLTRPYEGKKALFIDYGGNINKFGRMEDLTIENYEHDGWGVYSGEQLLTGVSMSGPKITKSILSNGAKREASLHTPNLDLKMNFGKYNGVKIKDLPIHYIKWLLDNEIPLPPDIKISILEKIKPTN